MRTLKHKVAVITGAGSGIGKALALELARRGCRLALNDIRLESLEETAEQIRRTGKAATIHKADIADRDQVNQFCTDVLNEHGRVDLLVNNAGVSMSRCAMQEIPLDLWESIFKVNFWGTLHCIRAFYSFLAAQKEAHIVNISSIYGKISASNRAPYCASKFAVQGLTETMIQENLDSNIRVTSVMPGLVSTNLPLHAMGWKDATAQEASFQFLTKNSLTSPQLAARKIVNGISRNRKRILIGPDARLLDFLYRLFPSLTLKLAHRVATIGEQRVIARMDSARKKELAMEV